MNRRGFTLIELLAVLILIAIIGVIILPTAIDSTDKSKDAAYNIMIENIVTSSKIYYEECEYGDLKGTMGNGFCEINNNNTISTTLGKLAETGILTGNFIKKNESGNFEVRNPKDNEDISNCGIIITKTISPDEYKKVTYTVTESTENTGEQKCPDTYEEVK